MFCIPWMKTCPKQDRCRFQRINWWVEHFSYYPLTIEKSRVPFSKGSNLFKTCLDQRVRGIKRTNFEIKHFSWTEMPLCRVFMTSLVNEVFFVLFLSAPNDSPDTAAKQQRGRWPVLLLPISDHLHPIEDSVTIEPVCTKEKLDGFYRVHTSYGGSKQIIIHGSNLQSWCK